MSVTPKLGQLLQSIPKGTRVQVTLLDSQRSILVGKLQIAQDEWIQLEEERTPGSTIVPLAAIAVVRIAP